MVLFKTQTRQSGHKEYCHMWPALVLVVVLLSEVSSSAAVNTETHETSRCSTIVTELVKSIDQLRTVIEVSDSVNEQAIRETKLFEAASELPGCAQTILSEKDISQQTKTLVDSLKKFVVTFQQPEPKKYGIENAALILTLLHPVFDFVKVLSKHKTKDADFKAQVFAIIEAASRMTDLVGLEVAESLKNGNWDNSDKGIPDALNTGLNQQSMYLKLDLLGKLIEYQFKKKEKIPKGSRVLLGTHVGHAVASLKIVLGSFHDLVEKAHVSAGAREARTVLVNLFRESDNNLQITERVLRLCLSETRKSMGLELDAIRGSMRAPIAKLVFLVQCMKGREKGQEHLDSLWEVSQRHLREYKTALLDKKPTLKVSDQNLRGSFHISSIKRVIRTTSGIRVAIAVAVILIFIGGLVTLWFFRKSKSAC